jgi:hypothetical protein
LYPSIPETTDSNLAKCSGYVSNHVIQEAISLNFYPNVSTIVVFEREKLQIVNGSHARLSRGAERFERFEIVCSYKEARC